METGSICLFERNARTAIQQLLKCCATWDLEISIFGTWTTKASSRNETVSEVYYIKNSKSLEIYLPNRIGNIKL